MRIFAILIAVCAILSSCVAVVAQDEPVPPAPDAMSQPGPDQAPPDAAPQPAPDQAEVPDVAVEPIPEPPAPDATSEPVPQPPPAPDAVVADPVPTPNAPAAPPARAASPRTAPVRPPMGSAAMTRRLVIGPTDSQGPPRRERGSITVSVMPPSSAKIVSAEVFCNSALVGQKSQAPYEMEFNTATLPDGAHMFKAVGLDASGKQVWTATTKVDVHNAGVGPGTKPNVPGKPALGAKVMPPAPPISPVGPTQPRNVVGPPVTANAAKSVQPPATPTGAPGLSKAYTSAKYGFSVIPPAGWSAKDKTASMKPKKSGNGWIEFAPPGKNANLTINVRRVRLSPSSDADTFAKHNAYVTKWERKTIGDSQAFATTTTESPKKVIYRLIMIKNGYAWMLNCIDTSGQQSGSSQELFQSVVDSLSVLVPAKSKDVSVTEIK